MRSPTIKVRGKGTAKLPAELGVLPLTIRAEASNKKDARSQVNATMRRLLKQIRALAAAPDTSATTPDTDWTTDEDHLLPAVSTWHCGIMTSNSHPFFGPRVPAGIHVAPSPTAAPVGFKHTARAELRVTFRDTAALGTFAAALADDEPLVEMGFGGVKWRLTEETKMALRGEAAGKAYMDAHRQAVAYANAYAKASGAVSKAVFAIEVVSGSDKDEDGEESARVQRWESSSSSDDDDEDGDVDELDDRLRVKDARYVPKKVSLSARCNITFGIE